MEGDVEHKGHRKDSWVVDVKGVQIRDTLFISAPCW